MSLQVFNDLEQRSEAWYAARCGIVTASAVGNLLTVAAPGADAYECPECAAPPAEPCISLRGGAPIKTMHSGRASVATASADTVPPVIKAADNDTSRNLAMSLAAERITGHVEDTYASPDMWRGIESEPYARELYGGHHAEATECGFMVRDFDGFKIGYSPDGLVGDDGLIEIKAPRQKNHLATVIANEVPAGYMAQMQAGLLVSGREWCDFIPYCGGMALWVKRVWPDQRWQAAILEAVEQTEKAIGELVATYQRAVDGLPVTERIDFNQVELKL